MRLAIVLLCTLLAGCSQLRQGIAIATDQMCSDEGEAARSAFRSDQNESFIKDDKALCARCPGETELKCTGDPKALPK